MPEEVQDLYRYNPEKAKALLAEAGYPNGFKANIIIANDAFQIDLLSAYKEMWSKIGVELTLQPKESVVFNSIFSGLSFEEMMWAPAFGGIGRYYSCNSFDGPGMFNTSQANDAHVKEVKAQLVELFNKQDFTTMASVYRSLMPYVLEQAWVIPTPIAYGYVVWWPWIKNYHGEISVGYGQACWPQYVWIDKDMKEKIKGK
jgi:peptide/nickel transport system substrate-binding protein